MRLHCGKWSAKLCTNDYECYRNITCRNFIIMISILVLVLEWPSQNLYCAVYYILFPRRRRVVCHITTSRVLFVFRSIGRDGRARRHVRHLITRGTRVQLLSQTGMIWWRRWASACYYVIARAIINNTFIFTCRNNNNARTCELIIITIVAYVFYSASTSRRR